MQITFFARLKLLVKDLKVKCYKNYVNKNEIKGQKYMTCRVLKYIGRIVIKLKAI